MMLTTAVIDRFEEDKAVLLVGEAEKKVIFPQSELPADLNEGDYLKIEISFDEEQTEQAKKEAAELLASLKEK